MGFNSGFKGLIFCSYW